MKTNSNLTLKEKWLHLYDVTAKIASYSPWDAFGEDDTFAYIWKDRSKCVFFSFINDSIGKRGIACYIDEDNYLRARARLASRNEKQEPVFMLQNAFICLWDDREDLSKRDYELIKELGLKFRGRGAWLHFDKYKIGYTPSYLSEDEIDFLMVALDNLHMMIRAIYEKGLDPEFDKRRTLVRGFDEDTGLYHTERFDIKPSSDAILRPLVTVHESEHLNEVRSMKRADYSVQLDWSYVDAIYVDEDGCETFPLLLLAVEPKSGFVLFSRMFPPSYGQANAAFDALDELCERHGKPSEIVICDEDLHAILSDACSKVGIRLTLQKRLPAVKKARTEFIAAL